MDKEFLKKSSNSAYMSIFFYRNYNLNNVIKFTKKFSGQKAPEQITQPRIENSKTDYTIFHLNIKSL